MEELVYSEFIARLSRFGYGFAVNFHRDEYEDGMPVTRVIVRAPNNKFVAEFTTDGTFVNASWDHVPCTAKELEDFLRKMMNSVRQTAL